MSAGEGALPVRVVGEGRWAQALAGLVPKAGNTLADDADLVLVAAAASALPGLLPGLGLGPRNRVIVCARGLEPQGGRWLSSLVAEATPCLRVGVLAGPVLAGDLERGVPGAAVVASAYENVRELGVKALHSSAFRVYTSPDPRAAELAGSAVRVLSVAVGIADALGMGPGVRGLVSSRGLAEAARLARAMKLDVSTLHGLAGLGDLVASTAHAEFPGLELGRRLARGETAPDAEEVLTARALAGMAAKHRVELPLTQAVAAIATGRLPAEKALRALMERAAAGAEA